jgi:nitrous oxidase accessory protein NosD
VWNGKDAPPEKVDDSVVKGVRLRTFKTRTGHTLQYIEEDKGGSKAGIRLETTKGHKIYLNDSDQFIEIKTTGGHVIKMDDRGKSITIETTGGHSIKMNDMSKSVEIKSTGNLDINATGVITIKGSLIKLN